MAAYAGVPLAIAAVAGIFLAILAWRHIEMRDGVVSFEIPSVVLPWMLLLGIVAIGALVLGLLRLRAPVTLPVTALGDRLIDALRSGEHDLARTQRVTVEVVNALPDSIYFTSERGKIVGVDDAWQRLFGVSRTAFVCNLVQTLYPRAADAAAGTQAMHEVVINHTRHQVYRTTITTGSGERIETFRNKEVIAPADISAAGLIGTVVNIVERKEAELLRHARLCEDRVGRDDFYRIDRPRRY